MELTTRKGQTFFIDDEDYDLVKDYNWFLTIKGYVAAPIRKDRKIISMHRLVLGAKDGEFVDHKDGNRVNNKKENLRICTNSENSKNKKPHGKSKYLGVTLRYKMPNLGKYKVKEYDGTPRFIASIKADGRPSHIGMFVLEEDAARAYDREAKKYHGEFARLNFPHE